MTTTAIVAISDLHVGSTVGLCPPDGIQVQDGNRPLPSKFQCGMWTVWVNFWNEFVARKLEKVDKKALVINGDLIDGNHHNTVNIVTPDIVHQRRAAKEILKPIVRHFDKVYITRGTEVHAGQGGQDDEDIGEGLKAQQDELGDYSSWQWKIEEQGLLFHFAHHIGVTSSTAYESSAPMREMVAGFVEAGQWGTKVPNYIIRSHRHRYARVCIPSMYGEVESIITPAWQLRTPHVERIDRMRMPHLGGVIFLIRDGVCQTLSKIYQIPDAAATQI